MKFKKLIAVIIAICCAFAFGLTACGQGDANADKFAEYKTQKVEYVGTLATSDDTEAVKLIVSTAQDAIRAVEYNKDKSLEENKSEIDNIVSKAESDVKSEKAVLSDYVVNGFFKETYAVSIDTEADATLTPIMGLVFNIVHGEKRPELVQELNAVTKVKDCFDFLNMFFLPDGKWIMAVDYADLMTRHFKAMDPTTTDEKINAPQQGTYKVSEEPQAGTKSYCLNISNGDYKGYTFDIGTGNVNGSYFFTKEVYAHNSNIQPPEVGEPVDTMDPIDRNDDSSPLPVDAALNAADKDLYSKIKSGGEIEAKYLGKGSYAVEAKEFIVPNDLSHKVWYPSEMKTGTAKYPLIVMSNGTGTTYDKYEPVLEHLASWGFIVIANNEGSSGTGAASEKSLNYILALNDNAQSEFYQKIDTDKIGSAGHSQGGVGSINAVTAQPSGNKYKAIYSACTTQSGIAAGILGCPYDASKITVPFFAVSSTGTTDTYHGATETEKGMGWSPLSTLTHNYEAAKTTDKIFARRINADHGHMLAYGDGYMIAWFMWHLKGDESAKAAFYGDNAEIKNNANWRDVTKNI